MGRRNVKDGLAALLKGANGFDAQSSGTVSINDWRCLERGVNRAAIIRNSLTEASPFAYGPKNEARWGLDVELYVRHNNDYPRAWEEADTFLQNLIDKIHSDHTFGGSCLTAEIVQVQAGDAEVELGGRRWLMETITVRAIEDL